MRVGIAGYGNLGRSLERLIISSLEYEIAGVFTRRKITEVQTLGSAVYPFIKLSEMRDKIDVLFLCYGSSSDMPDLAPILARSFNTVDTFDNHKESLVYKEKMNISAKAGGHTSVVCLGWDPGFLSAIRLICDSFFPNACVNTFWGRGVSQGHTEALKRIPGVKKAVQYTVPCEDALVLASLVCHPISDTDRHRRVCYIVAEDGKEDLIKNEVLKMKNYFAGYKTQINFVSESEFDSLPSLTSHRGRVYALGSSGKYREVKHSLYLDLDIGSNPDFTASVMLASARALTRLADENKYGAYDIFDIPISYFSPLKCENVNNYL